MRCYKCNSVLPNDDVDYCLKCGADVSVYKVVVKASNIQYNLGLEKARVRDLSGAIVALKSALNINSNNVKARNLLGLIYFEMGEVALALSEWVVSLNIKSEKNVAEVYIKKVKANPNRLEAINQAAKKYNFALNRAKSGGDDVALIQLKKVVQSAPKFVKAHLLLALLYMKKGDNDRATKILNKVLKIDVNNTLALKYLREIKLGIPVANKDESAPKNNNRKDTESLTGHDVIIPTRTTYKETSNAFLTVLYILIGVVIGVAIVWFLVVPAKLQTAQADNNDSIKKYSEQLSAYSIDITNLEEKNEELKKQLDLAKMEINNYTGSGGEIELYNKLVEAAKLYVEDDFDKAAVALAEIDVTQLPTENAKALYTTMEDNCNSGARTFYIAGVNAYNKENYVDALTYLSRAYSMDDSNAETPYYIAMSFLKLNDAEGAQPYVDLVLTNYKDSSYAKQLEEYLNPTEEEKTTESE